jgi:menaquinone-dependent protoporphyrinogen IX oxidase
MKGLIIYKSKYGAVRQYAHWAGNDLNLPVIEMGAVTTDKIKQADFIIIGSSIYIGKSLNRKWLRKHKRILAEKELFLFFACGTPSNKTLQLEKYLEASVPVELRGKAHTFFLPGRMIVNRLSRFDRFILKMGARLMKKDGQHSILQDYNNLEREHINELVASVKQATGSRVAATLREPEGSYPV